VSTVFAVSTAGQQALESTATLVESTVAVVAGSLLLPHEAKIDIAMHNTIIFFIVIFVFFIIYTLK
jgi:hypothetical protein